MKKEPIRLKDIKPKAPLSAPPERYFDELPGRISARVDQERKQGAQWRWQPVARLALVPALAIILAIWLWPGTAHEALPPSVEQMLAEVPSDELLHYLADMEALESYAFEVEVLYEELDDFEEASAPAMEHLELEEEVMEEYLQEWDAWEG